MNSAAFTEANERREASRVGREEACDYAILVTPEGETRAEVLDESLLGIRIALATAPAFTSGSEVAVRYAGETRCGIVRHLHPRAGGGYVVGIDCAAGVLQF